MADNNTNDMKLDLPQENFILTLDPTAPQFTSGPEDAAADKSENMTPQQVSAPMEPQNYVSSPASSYTTSVVEPVQPAYTAPQPTSYTAPTQPAYTAPTQPAYSATQSAAVAFNPAMSAPAAPQFAAPQLTVTPDVAAAPEVASRPAAPASAAQADLQMRFTPEELKQVTDFSKQIDVTNSNLVLQYGAAAQKKISSFAETALDKVRTQDLGEAGDLMTQLVGELKGFTDEDEDKGGIFGWFKKATNQVELMKSRYDKVSLNIDKIVDSLTGHQMELMKDISMFDKMYQANLSYYKELTMYIEAGKLRLAEVRAKDVPALQAKARASGSAEDAQTANDLVNMCGRFEKKLYDLDLTRNISIQMGPQIRLLQNNDQQMAEKIQSSLVNTIPLWKNQMVLALGLEHSKEAMEAQRSVTDMTNQLLRQNADTLKMGSVETAKEAERGIIDIETLKYTNQSLIDTLDQVLKIQQDGAAKRQAAEQDLRKIESDLKNKMLEMRG